MANDVPAVDPRQACQRVYGRPRDMRFVVCVTCKREQNGQRGPGRLAMLPHHILCRIAHIVPITLRAIFSHSVPPQHQLEAERLSKVMQTACGDAALFVDGITPRGLAVTGAVAQVFSRHSPPLTLTL